MSETSPLVLEARSTCPSCAAVNPSGSPFCWQCYTRFPEAASGPPEWARPNATGEDVTPPPTAAPAPRRGRRVLGVVLLLALAAGAFVAWRILTAGPFPSTFRSYERIDTSEAKRFEDGVGELGELLGVEMHGAQYGHGSELAILAVVAEQGVPPGELRQRFVQTPTPRPRQVVEADRDGATFACFPADTSEPGSVCTWADGGRVGVVYGRFLGVDEHLELTAELRAAVS